MAIQEAIAVLGMKCKILQPNDRYTVFDVDHFEISYTATGLKYLFDCYDRIEEEKRQYPKVKIFFNSLFVLIYLLLLSFIEE